MKKISISILVLMLNLGLHAQSQDTIIEKQIDENYLVRLFQHADIIYCKVDDVDDFIYAKKMEIAFTVGSSIFRTAYIESNLYSTTIGEFVPPWCVYVILDDTIGNTLKLKYETSFAQCESDEEPLNDLQLLRPVLDSLLQNTDTIDYSLDTRIMLDIGND